MKLPKSKKCLATYEIMQKFQAVSTSVFNKPKISAIVVSTILHSWNEISDALNEL